jgi:hypothetical protein
MSKSWRGDTVAEGVGRHGVIAVLKLSLVHCRFLCSSEVRAERTKKKKICSARPTRAQGIIGLVGGSGSTSTALLNLGTEKFKQFKFKTQYAPPLWGGECSVKK